MTENITIQIITTLGLVVVAWLGNRKLNRIGSDAKEAREQTANSHQNAEFPNLREELTAVHADVREVAEIVRGHDRHLERLDRHLEDLHTEDTHIEDTIDRKTAANARALAAAVDERNTLYSQLRQELNIHITQCEPPHTKHQ